MGSTGKKLRVVVGDDHPLYREGLVRALRSSGEIDVVGDADNGQEALELIKRHRPDVALLDFMMPGLDGAQIAAAARRDDLPTRVLLVSAHTEAALVYQALNDGAAGFLRKESTGSEVVHAVLECARGRDVLSPQLAADLAGEIRRRGETPELTLSPRERDVLALIAKGHTIAAMGKELYLAPSTIKTHIERLYEKLGVGDRGAAVAEAMRRGLLE